MKRLSACILTFSLLIGLSGAQPASVWAQSTDTDETDPPVSEEGTDDSAISEFLLSDSDDPVLYRNGG